MENFSAKRYFYSLVFVLLLSLGALLYLIIKVNPTTAEFSQIGLFYATLFLLGLSTFTLAGYIFRVSSSRNSPLKIFAYTSLRQGILFSLLLVVCLFLQSLRALSILSVVLLVVSITLLELAFLSR